MEVHHHPDLHHKKKPWTEYLLEFLMIFLAVTMGFFAETIRENITNREKERQYVESMIADLKSDTSALKNYLRLERLYGAMLDSLIVILDDSASISRRGD